MAKTVTWKVGYDASGVQRGARDAEASLTGLDSAVNRVGSGLGALQGRGTSTFSLMGSAVGALDMNPLIGSIGQVGNIVDRLGGQLRSTRADGEALNRTLLMAGVGAALTAAGAGLEHLAAPLAKAQADLEGAFTGANADLADFQGQIDSTVSHMERYGHTADDTDTALAKMTVATGDPAQALGEMNFVLTVATYKHESLGEAASQVAKAHAGSFRAFKDFGINVGDMTSAITDAAAAEKKLAEENVKLQMAQQSLADFEARMVEARKASIDLWAEKVGTANQRALDSDQNLADVEGRIADQTAQRQQTAADAATAAREAQMSAEERLADLRERLADKGQPSIQQQHALQKAHTDVERAQRDLISGTGAYTDRVQRLADAQDRLNELEAVQRESTQLSVTERQELRHAEEAVADAKDKTAAADAKVKTAGEQTRSESVELRKALEAQAKAHDDLADTQAKAAKAGELTLAQQQEERKLRDAVTTATDKQGAAAQDAATKSAAAAAVGVVFTTLQEEVMRRFGTAADERADTFAGKVDMVKAKIADGAAVFGEKWAPTITGVGIGLMGLSALLSLGSGVMGFFGGSAATASVGVDTLAGSEIAATAATAGLDSGLIPLIGSIGLILLPILALAGAAYLIYNNWDSIASWFADRWDNVKNIFTDAKDWCGDKIGELVGFITGLPGRAKDALDDAAHTLYDKGSELLGGLIVGIHDKEWDLIGWFQDLPGNVISWIGDTAESLYNTGWNTIVGLWNGIVDSVEKYLGGIGSFLWDHTIGAISRALGISSPSTEAHKIGMFFGQGLANGITGSGDLVVGAVDQVNGRLLGRQLASVSVAASQVASSMMPAAGGGPGAGSTGGSGGTVEHHTHIHLERGSIEVNAGHVGTADDLVDVVHEGLQRKLSRTGNLQLTP